MSTKFLRKTARRLIRDFDQFQDTYPQLIRSSDPLDNGVDSDARFADDRSIVFSTINTSFPAMVPVGSTTMQSSSISEFVNITPAVVEQRPQLPGSSESLKPFDENLFYLPAVYENTASISLAPGFNIPARDKIAIPINITSQQEKPLFRLGLNDTNADPGGLFYGQSSTGFCYYNFDLKRWEDIGLSNNSYFGYMGNVTPANETTFSGQNYFMAQFVGTPNRIGRPTGTSYEDAVVNYFGYNKIGRPTEFFDAPAAPRYHATSSQGLPMSNYIQQPFVLERVDVKLPFVARRKHGNQTGGATDPFESSLRDIDNLVFFVYRQSGNNRETSQRFLITHESLTFYNSAINENANFLTHDPAFSYDYQLSVSSSQEALFTGSISFSMYPKVTSPNFGGVSSYSVYDTAGSVFRRAGVLNFWTGPMLSTISSSINTVNGRLGPSGNNTFWRIKNTTDDVLIFDAQLDPDQRFLNNFATGTLLPTVAGGTLIGPAPYESFNSINWSQHNAPYVLVPEDRLIFGLESDICNRITSNGTYANGSDKSPLSVTSSFFKILTDYAQVTLYGSLVQESVAKRHNSINQNLVSPAVHEIIANTQDDTDQFDIAEQELFVGTYSDNFITGSLITGNRGVAQSIIDGPDILSGSFIRCLPLLDSQKTYYQNGPSTVTIGAPPFTQTFNLLYSSPKNPINYFRLNKYGNFRDMLEQAQDYRIFNKEIYLKNGGFEDQGPVYAKFVLSSSDINVDPSLTQCNNLSPYATGTFPFDDIASGSLSRDAYQASTFNSPFTPKTLIFKT
jgi:hypothetical protein